MIQYLSYLKLVPAIALLAAVAYGAHKFIVIQKEQEIVELRISLDDVRSRNIALQTAAEINVSTIRSLESRINTQINQISNLTGSMQQLQTEKDEYLSIFRRHNLQRLAQARPGLIEPRINQGTKDVFAQLEEDSQRLGGQ
jgi:TolA-binding protein